MQQQDSSLMNFMKEAEQDQANAIWIFILRLN